MKLNLNVRKGLILLFWFAVWEAAGRIIHNPIIFVGPIDMLVSLMRQSALPDFWITISGSLIRICLGFFLAFFLGLLTGAAAWRFPLLRELLEPVILLMKSIPVASFIILALIWIGSRQLSVLIAFLMVFPILYISTVTGLSSTDPALLEMAQVFCIRPFQKFRYIYRSALHPHLISGCQMALGMSWKAGIAAEVIGVPSHSIGERLYLSKIYLDTADLFAWTFVIIVISIIFEKLILFCLIRTAPGNRRKWRPS